MAEKRASSSAGFENPQVPKKLANFKKPQSEPIQSYMCFVCNETLVMSKPDMQIHVFNCRSTDTEVIEEAENEMTQETLVGNQVSQEAPRSASTGSFQGRFSRVDSSRSGTGSPSSSLARSTSLSGASERSSVTPLTQDMAHTGTPRAQSTGTSTGTSGIGTCTYTPSASGISSSSRNLVTPTSSGTPLARSTPSQSGKSGSSKHSGSGRSRSRRNPVTPNSSGSKGSARRNLQASPSVTGTPKVSRYLPTCTGRYGNR